MSETHLKKGWKSGSATGCDFIYQLDQRKQIVRVIQTNPEHGRSLTNSVESVGKYIAGEEHIGKLWEWIFVYQNTENKWDSVEFTRDMGVRWTVVELNTDDEAVERASAIASAKKL